MPPVVEVGTRRQQPGGENSGIVCPCADGERAPCVRPEQGDPFDPGHGDQVIDCIAQVIHPSLQREVTAAVTAATEGEGHARVADLVGQAVHQLWEGAGRASGVDRSDREAMDEDQPG